METFCRVILVPVMVVTAGGFVTWASVVDDPSSSTSADSADYLRPSSQPPSTGFVDSESASLPDPAPTEPTPEPSSGSSEAPGDPESSSQGAAGPEPSAVESEALEESLERFYAARRKLDARIEQQVERRTATFEFDVASLNVLGDSHTGPGGRAGFPDASPRMDMSIAALRANGVDVVGFQEFESTQFAMFAARAGEYSLYPGLSLGTKSVRFNIAWRSDMWQLVEAHTLSVPYAGGSRIEMPVILLESIETGRRAWFANFHNPADTPRLGNNARWRAEAAALEVAHLTELRGQGDYPVVVTGDFNERAEVFCRFTAGGVFSAASGGSVGSTCLPPERMEVDWIFGSTGVSFADYAAADIGRASDHRLVHARAVLGDDATGGR